MRRTKTTLAALCAIAICLSFAIPSVWARPITNEFIYNNLDGQGVFDVLDGDNFTEQINFPPQPDDPFEWVEEEDDLVDGEYTISFPAGAGVTFTDGLTIRTYAGIGGDAIGRIQVQGEAGNMVTMDEAVPEEGWDGIWVLTFPEWENLISYCEITNAGAGVEIGTIENSDGQCIVVNSHIHNNEGNGIQVWGPIDGSDYSIRNNDIHDNGWTGIQVDDAFDGADPEDAVMNNVVYNNTGYGIQLHNSESTIYVKNNIIYGNDESQIELWNATENPVIVNNVVDGQDIENIVGINVLLGWSTGIYNNIIVNCSTGISYDDPDGEDFFNCLFDGNETDFTEGLDDIDCVEGSADFVDDENGDYHLGPASDAIDEGDDAQGIDLNFTHNDMGAYGG